MDQIEKVNQLRSAMYEALNGRLATLRLRVAAFSPAAAKAQLDSRLNRVRMQLDSESTELRHRMDMMMGTVRSRTELLRHKMEALSPIAVLERGYGIIAGEDGKTVRSVSQVKEGDSLTLTLKDGKIRAAAREVING